MNKPDCTFCKIASGAMTTPGVFWEDENFMAFLSKWPNTEGFSVVIPKKHFGSDVLAMPDDILCQFVKAAKTVSRILVECFRDVGRVGLMMEGTGVDHAHIKLFPMHGTEHLSRGEWRQHPSTRRVFYNTYQGYLASHNGPEADEDKLRRLAEKLKGLK